MYHEIMLNSLAYLGLNDIRQIEDMTLSEYTLRMEAYQIQQIKRQEELAMIAWFNQIMQETTGGKKPKLVHDKFTKLYDAQKNIDNIRGSFEEDYIPRINQADNQADLFNKRLNEFKELKNKGLIKPWAERSNLEKGGF